MKWELSDYEDDMILLYAYGIESLGGWPVRTFVISLKTGLIQRFSDELTGIKTIDSRDFQSKLLQFKAKE